MYVCMYVYVYVYVLRNPFRPVSESCTEISQNEENQQKRWFWETVKTQKPTKTIDFKKLVKQQNLQKLMFLQNC